MPWNGGAAGLQSKPGTTSHAVQCKSVDKHWRLCRAIRDGRFRCQGRYYFSGDEGSLLQQQASSCSTPIFVFVTEKPKLLRGGAAML